ncbi:hypothetical protein [Mycobacterium sp.]|uniref:hypothetical protein n=1 Tax=Mycobacterium sp. TaxID=1785 RepID=UPI003C736B86
MSATKAAALAAVWTATAAATIGLAAPAHAATAVNLPVIDDVRAELLQAGAVLTGRPATEFTGLRPGTTYYAFVPSETNPTYWAAAALAGPKSEAAGISLQDQNSYLMFHKSGDPAATWVPIAAGFGPIPAGEQPCPIPQSVRDVWQWPAGKCYPPTS